MASHLSPIPAMKWQLTEPRQGTPQTSFLIGHRHFAKAMNLQSPPNDTQNDLNQKQHGYSPVAVGYFSLHSDRLTVSCISGFSSNRLNIIYSHYRQAEPTDASDIPSAGSAANDGCLPLYYFADSNVNHGETVFTGLLKCFYKHYTHGSAFSAMSQSSCCGLKQKRHNHLLDLLPFPWLYWGLSSSLSSIIQISRSGRSCCGGGVMKSTKKHWWR